MPRPLRLEGLRGFARREIPASRRPSPHQESEHCDLCAAPLADGHGHLVDTGAQAILCACRACAVLFDRQASGDGQYRLVRRLRRPLPDFRCDDTMWAALGVPVDLAFFVRHDAYCEAARPSALAPSQNADVGAAATVTAHYPSPIGTVGAAVPLESWQQLTDANPGLSDMDSEVVALLTRRERRARRASDHWLLGIDDCYELTALLRRWWTGLTGGERIWREVDSYFDRLREDAA
jgi:hypothetical protein